jgi:hypothetical protein
MDGDRRQDNQIDDIITIMKITLDTTRHARSNHYTYAVGLHKQSATSDAEEPK